VSISAVDAGGAAVKVDGETLRDLAPGTRYSWFASIDGSTEASGSFVTPPAATDRSVRFAVLADYGSGNDDEWAVGRLLAAQQPEFALTAGDNSYLVAAEVLLDRNIFRPLGELMRGAPLYVCLGDHDTFFPGPSAISSAFDLPPEGRFVVHHGPIQVVILGDEPNEPGAIAFARKHLREAGPAVRFVVCHRPLQEGDEILPVLRDAKVDALFCGHLHRYERRTVGGVQTFTVGTGGQGPGSLAHTKATPGADVSLLDIGALTVEVRSDGIAYTYLDKRGAVLDHVVI
jgi:predicted phosphodiesterase